MIEITFQLETCPVCGKDRPVVIAALPSGELVCGKCFDLQELPEKIEKLHQELEADEWPLAKQKRIRKKIDLLTAQLQAAK